MDGLQVELHLDREFLEAADEVRVSAASLAGEFQGPQARHSFLRQGPDLHTRESLSHDHGIACPHGHPVSIARAPNAAVRALAMRRCSAGATVGHPERSSSRASHQQWEELVFACLALWTLTARIAPGRSLEELYAQIAKR